MDIKRNLETVKPDKTLYTIYKYDKLDSTNTFLKQHCSTLPDYSVIWADEQTDGRGRFTRIWNSQPGMDLTFSLLLPLTSLEQKLRQNITQVAALSVAQILEGYGLEPSVKWPNDVLVHGKKISGILCEVAELNERVCGVLGIGINVNNTEEFLANLDLPATSLHCELRHKVVRQDLLKKLLEIIINRFDVLCQTGFTQNRQEIRKKLAFINEQIVFTDVNQDSYSGKIIDLNDDGTLLFECEKRGIISLNSGEIAFHNSYTMRKFL
ncbi:MAG: biotin--[acetyl-CoA-carboxylase] ligase [Candidatus Scalindua rubra]|uniref:biotin--[biotin carboxyl-carrier protein] ligase n=1 Tax=Candidatus Scalindua brodae TaxID=237368 RepID=A0A0B0EHE0_9BACT|nr:MAG: bifunctional protein Bir A biotin-[acetyl-CoA carboxylase] synthetase / biotin operon repressor [Candidatus Scalindua brodae]MBZ0109921.1 biotin--[acetyl-CoA-carboxylase] ligase [Candidatus Scalindua rubra]